MKRDVFFVLLSYGQAHRAEALQALRGLAQRLLPHDRLRGVVVENTLDGEVEIELDESVNCISGDNSMREFSGWDRGLGWLEKAYKISPDSVVMLGNDTVHRSYGRSYLNGFTEARLSEALLRNGLVGWVDAYPREVILFGQPFRRWLRTNLILAPRRVVDRLRPFALSFVERDIFSSDVSQLFRIPSPLSDNYRRYLRTWLFGEAGEPEFTERWHSAEPLTSRNAEALKGKIRSILCEHHLSARAQALGMPLIDVR